LQIELDTISWRKLLVLIQGLSPNSALVNHLQHGRRIITDPEEAERVVDRIW